MFGAGADAPFGVGTGGDFASTVLGVRTDSSSIEDMNTAIRRHYSSFPYVDGSWYPSFQLRTWKEADLIKAALRRKLLEEGKKVKDDDFKLVFDKVNNDISEKISLINKYPSYMGLIDSKFPTIIAPSVLGQVKFWQVVSSYCRAYLTIMQQVLGRNDYDSFLVPTDKLIREIREISKTKTAKDTYYSIIQQKKTSVDVSVVTTNYTYYCEEVSGLSAERIAYVHGRIGLFESPRDLCVYDVEHDDITGEIVFPYLFIQSGVKPIVERQQIEEYSKMIKFMDESDKIIILGYHLNYDDNHINSIVRSEVVKGKEIVYLSFDDGKMIPLDRNAVLKKLKLPDSTVNLRWRKITSKDANKIFEEELQ